MPMFAYCVQPSFRFHVNLPHATDGVLDLDLSNDFASIRFDLLQEFSLLRDSFLECRFKVWLESGGI
jgi:hypothetical protein